MNTEKELNFYGKLTHNVIHNRPLATIIFIASLVLGIGSYIMTPKQYNPQVTLPAFSIQVEYPGASAKEVEQLVTKELEEKISDIPGVDTLTSYSFDGGMAFLQVSFEVGQSLESARVALQSKIMENIDLREGSIAQPLVKTISPDDVPILEIGFTSSLLSQNQLRERVLELSESLQTIEGVANIQTVGGEPKALLIHVLPEKLKAFSVSLAEVYSILNTSNVQMLAGTIDSGKTQEEIFISSPLSSYKIQQLAVSSGVRLSDIAEVKEGFTEKKSFVQVSSSERIQDAVLLSVAKREGENGIVVAEHAMEFLNTQKPLLEKQGIFFDVYRNEGETAAEAIFHLGRDLTISIIIVVLLLLLFLGKRESFIVAIAIPLTLGLVFFVGFLFGQTINRITLFALILALGLLVDDAIVVVENIHRHLKNGTPKKQAIVQAVNEVGVGLFLCTFSAIIVFLPLTQITGMMGPYMGPLSFFVPWSLVLSLFVAYILTPFLADILLPQTLHSSHNNLSFFDKIADWYAHILKYILQRKALQKLIIFSTFGALVVSFIVPFIPLVHFKMLPKADKDQIYIYLDALEGTDVPATHQYALQVAQTVQKNTEVQTVEIFTATPPVLDFNGLYKGAFLRNQDSMSTLRINLRHESDRSISSEEIAMELRKSLFQLGLPVSLKILEDPPGPPVLATLLAKVKTEDDGVRNIVTQDIKNFFIQTNEVVDIDTSQEVLFPRTVYEINYEEVRNAGVSIDHIAKTLWVALGPQRIMQYYDETAKEMAFVELSVPASFRDEKLDLSALTVSTSSGEIVPIMTFLIPKSATHVPVILRDEKVPSLYVTAEMGERSVVYASLEILWKLWTDYRPAGAVLSDWNLFGVTYALPNGQNVQIEFGGEWEMTLKNFRDLGIAMIVSMFLVYVLLVAQFKSFSASGLIMLTVPMALIGIIFGFVFLDFFGVYLTATALIGFIALIGLVVKNGILFLEYYDYKREEGMSREQALIEAGRIRMQPIVLTSLTAILANLTIVQDPVWSGLAWAIVFGLSVSTLLSLLIFPIVYNLVNPKR